MNITYAFTASDYINTIFQAVRPWSRLSMFTARHFVDTDIFSCTDRYILLSFYGSGSVNIKFTLLQLLLQFAHLEIIDVLDSLETLNLTEFYIVIVHLLLILTYLSLIHI